MRDTRFLMGMPITLILTDASSSMRDSKTIFDFFKDIDNRFSTYKKNSEISQINQGRLQEKDFSSEMQRILYLANLTKQETNGYFDIHKPDGMIDPSGLVKGWAIWQAAKILQKKGLRNFSINAGGDIQTQGKNERAGKWRVGIKNPFNQQKIVKVVKVSGKGIATSGSYIRGSHIYNPLNPKDKLDRIVSITVIGKNVYEADRFATAAFAMQEKGIQFIESLSGFEGYMIDKNGMATYTSGFEKYVYTIR